MTTPQSPRPALTVWNIRHPGTGETLTCESFDEAMSKWFEGFNVPVLVTDGVPESFDSANARMKAHYARPNDSQPAPTEGGDEPCAQNTNDKCSQTAQASITPVNVQVVSASNAATQGASSLGAAGGEQGFPAEFIADIKKANIAIATQRNEDPNFKPSLSFLQRRMRWGFARASMVLPYVNTRTPDPAPAAARDAGGDPECKECGGRGWIHLPDGESRQCDCIFVDPPATPPPSAPVAREIERAKIKAELETDRADRDAWRTERDQWQQEASRLTGELEKRIEQGTTQMLSYEKAIREWKAALATATARTEALEEALQGARHAIAQSLAPISILLEGEYGNSECDDDEEWWPDLRSHALLATRPATRATGEHGPDTEGQA